MSSSKVDTEKARYWQRAISEAARIDAAGWEVAGQKGSFTPLAWNDNSNICTLPTAGWLSNFN
jgi:hypothetical protein